MSTYRLENDMNNMYVSDDQRRNGLPRPGQSVGGGEQPPPPYSTLDNRTQQQHSNVQIQVKGSSASSRRSESPVSLPAYANSRAPQTTYSGYPNPTPAPSKIVHSMPTSSVYGGYTTSSRPTSQGAQDTPITVVTTSGARNRMPPHSPHSSASQHQAQGQAQASPTKMKDPRPYQLRPMLDSVVKSNAVSSQGKPESEVDALTDLLMQSMEASSDPGFYGMCAKCGRAIMGENSGCSALDQLFHTDCFTCYACSTCLQGKPFFAMEGRPYCEQCYLNTLEKCTVCSKPITDRLLRATGKPYHAQCFTCVVCGISLDGITFTVDATSQIHCIPDFHKKFAPRCCVCNQVIVPNSDTEDTVRVVAMDRSFHPKCYKCEDCGIQLSSESEGRGCYPLDDHILCKSCNARHIQKLTTKMTTEL